MIVDSMTHEEVYQELGRDRDNIDRWFRHKLNENRRKILKCKNFPLSFWLEHTTPRKIRYLLYARVLNRHRQRMILTMVALRQMTDGIAAYLAWPVDNETIKPMVYLPHVFKRYADPERGNVPKKALNLSSTLSRETTGASTTIIRRLSVARSAITDRSTFPAALPTACCSATWRERYM